MTAAVGIERALLSVADKTGVAAFAGALRGLGVEILSTGGTLRTLLDADVPAAEVAAETGFPEIMDGRVKTLHPRIHGGILGRPARDAEVMAAHGIRPIGLVAVNLYPFVAAVARPGCTLEEAVENIDIGGPALLRAAAKNHRHVLVVVDPEHYDPVLERLVAGRADAAFRLELAQRAFAHTAAYDQAIAEHLRGAARPQPGRSHPPLAPP